MNRIPQYAVLLAGAAALSAVSACRTFTPDESDQGKAALQTQEQPAAFADQNRDGKVTRKEAKIDPALERVFDQYDLNRDSELDRAEFARLESETARRHSWWRSMLATRTDEPSRPRDEYARPLTRD